MWKCPSFLIALTCALLACGQRTTRAEEIPQDVRSAIDKGLEWIKKSQHKDGSWSANGQNPVAMTSMAGMALLAEGSTINQGKYRDQIRLAADWPERRIGRRGIGRAESDPVLQIERLEPQTQRLPFHDAEALHQADVCREGTRAHCEIALRVARRVHRLH